jgi:hypothetical protein
VNLVDLRCPDNVRTGAPFTVDFTLDATRDLDEPIVMVTLSAMTGQPIVSNLSFDDGAPVSICRGRNDVRIKYDSLPLGRGVYALSVVVAERYVNNQVLALINGRTFEVESDDSHSVGYVRLTPQWDSTAS